MLDLSNVKATNFEIIPEGKYLAACTDAVLKSNKAGTGEYIQATLTIQNGPQEGRKVFTNFNIANSNAKAVEIGQQQLKSFLENSNYKGDFKFGSPNEVPVAMHGLAVGIKTKIKQDQTYGDKAEVSYYFRHDAKLPDAGKPEEIIPF